MKEERNSAEINIMLSVLATQIKDYFNGIRRDGVEIAGRAKKAMGYILSNEVGYVFSFNFICLTIGLDPFRLKKRILEIKDPDQLQVVFNKLKKSA